MYQKGFSLIELLVVIAIIGVLSSVILPVANAARLKAQDAKLKLAIHDVAVTAESIYLDDGCYGNGLGQCKELKKTDCVLTDYNYPTWSTSLFAHPEMQARMNTVMDLTKEDGRSECTVYRDFTHGDGIGWAMIVHMNYDDTKAWCIDSRGTSQEMGKFTGESPNNPQEDEPYNYRDLREEIENGYCED